MSTLTCADCTTPYTTELQQCPHCSSIRHVEDGVTMRRLPTFLQVTCTTAECVMSGTVRSIRLNIPQLGLVELPNLYCSACGGQVPIPWPPEEEPMPKITTHGGATNAREQAEPSPDALASQPLAGAEAGQGHPTFATGGMLEGGPGEPLPELPAEAYAEDAVPLDEPEPYIDPYAGMTLTELRTAADDRGLASYGTKAQIADRLREADTN